jgi:hypothetical protein
MTDWRRSLRSKHVVTFLNKITKVCLRKISRFDCNTPRRPRGGYMASSTLSLNLALDYGRWSAARPGRLIPRERHPVPVVQETGSEQVRKITPLTEFDPGNVQRVASRYTV